MEASLFLFWSPNLHHGPRAETRGNGNENCELTTQETRKCANRLPFSRKAMRQNTERLQRKNDSYTSLTTPTMKVSSVLGKGRSTNSMS